MLSFFPSSIGSYSGIGGPFFKKNRLAKLPCRSYKESWTLQTYHELLFDLAQALQTGLKLKVVVRRGLGNGRDDGNVVTLGAHVVRRGNACNVDV